MATIKSYTDIEQSKKLAKILPLESADMKWFFWKEEIDAHKTPTFGYSKTAAESYKDTEAVYLACWSLSALLGVLSKTAHSIDEGGSVGLGSYKNIEWGLCLTNTNFELFTANNPVDACYKMIIKLNELNLL